MLADIFIIILSAVYWVLAPAALQRFYMQLLSLPFRNPLGQFVRAVTDWIILPLRRVFKGKGYDWASLIAAYLFELVFILLKTAALAGFMPFASPPGIARWLIAGVFGLAITVVVLMMVALLVYVVFSWVVPREGNPYAGILDAMVAPWLRPIRRYLPLIGGFDLSPLVAGVLLQIVYLLLLYARSEVLALVR
jgi:YggT family protein